MPSSPEKRLEQQRARRDADPEKFAAWGREWRAANAEHVRESQSNYRKAHGVTSRHEAAEIAQDIRAMKMAHNPSAVFSISRAMVGLGRWSAKAEDVATAALTRLGVPAWSSSEEKADDRR